MKLTNLDKELLQLLINSNSSLYLNKNSNSYRVKLYIKQYRIDQLNYSFDSIEICGINAFNLLDQITIHNEQLKYRYAALLPHKQLLTTKVRYTDKQKLELDQLHKDLSIKK